MKPVSFSIYIFLLFSIGTTNLSHAKENCFTQAKKEIKVEAWLSKKYEKSYKDIRKEFQEIGNTKVGLFIYPAENPSRVIAIGSCVPVYVAQYFLRKTNKYSIGTTHLVNQRLISKSWLGMGTPIFGKTSMSKVTSKQLAMLMDESLDTESFQKLYQSFTIQNQKIKLYGLVLDNPRFLSGDQY